jgi:hypothetical protein
MVSSHEFTVPTDECGDLGTLLPQREFADAYRTWPGLIPVAIDPERLRARWQDLGLYHFYESFFHRSLGLATALAREPHSRLETTLDVFENDRFADEAVPLAGLIFHAGRSRSTLLSRSIARSRENLVLSEPAALSGMVAIVAEHCEWGDTHGGRVFRNLVHAMCRKRVPSHQRSFIKFTSHNIASFGFIRAAFPDVPALFLSRDPEEIVASFRHSPPAWTDRLGNVEAVVRATLAHSETAGASLHRLDHRQVTAGNLPAILAHFGYEPDAEQLRLMRTQFAFDSKEDLRQRRYED